MMIEQFGSDARQQHRDFLHTPVSSPDIVLDLCRNFFTGVYFAGSCQEIAAGGIVASFIWEQLLGSKWRRRERRSKDHRERGGQHPE